MSKNLIMCILAWACGRKVSPSLLRAAGPADFIHMYPISLSLFSRCTPHLRPPRHHPDSFSNHIFPSATF